MADNDLKVIVKAKELAVHTFKLTSNLKSEQAQCPTEVSEDGNCHKLGRAMDEKINEILNKGA